jgi:hypothetical protein
MSHEPSTIVALVFEDGTVGRMQMFKPEPDDDAIQASIDKTKYPAGKPVSWQRVASVDAFEKTEAGNLILKKDGSPSRP